MKSPNYGAWFKTLAALLICLRTKCCPTMTQNGFMPFLHPLISIQSHATSTSTYPWSVNMKKTPVILILKIQRNIFLNPSSYLSTLIFFDSEILRFSCKYLWLLLESIFFCALPKTVWCHVLHFSLRGGLLIPTVPSGDLIVSWPTLDAWPQVGCVVIAFVMWWHWCQWSQPLLVSQLTQGTWCWVSHCNGWLPLWANSQWDKSPTSLDPVFPTYKTFNYRSPTSIWFMLCLPIITLLPKYLQLFHLFYRSECYATHLVCRGTVMDVLPKMDRPWKWTQPTGCSLSHRCPECSGYVLRVITTHTQTEGKTKVN